MPITPDPVQPYAVQPYAALRSRMREALRAGMKSRDRVAVGALRSALAAILRWLVTTSGVSVLVVTAELKHPYRPDRRSSGVPP